ncbi:MAG: response regulator [Comamonadaceae bacterium]|nr:MAG: response regulator [Comamonadaceae bacterium]
MTTPDFPANEIQRVLRLRQLGLLDTAPEDILDQLTRLAARATGMPVALLSLVDAGRQWCKSAVGQPAGREVPREVSFCAHAICQFGVFEVEDARQDPRFAGNPLVTGDPAFVHYAGAPLVMPGGEAVGTLCVAAPEPGRLDATQRDLLSDLAATAVQVMLLRERERNLSGQRLFADATQLSELAPVGMFAADAFGAVLHGNAKWVEMLGAADYTELAGALWRKAIHPDDLPALTRGWKEAVRARQPYSGTFRARAARDGEQRWIKFRVKPVDARLAPVAFVGTSVEVSETVRLEQQLQDKNDLLESIIQHLPCGLAVFDKDLAHVVSNATMRTLLGLPDHLFEGKPTFPSLAQYFASRGEYGEQDPQSAVARRMATIRAREPHRIERILRDGTLVEIRGSFMPDGGMILTYTDVTAARRADAELRRALEAADQANQAKSDFLATMSHEIRTPLNGVIGLTQLLAGANLPPMESDSVLMIDSCAKSLLSLVDNILDLSKIEAGRLTLDMVPTDLVQLVQEVSDVFSVRAAEKGIRFDLRHERHVPRWISADPGRLRQVLLNLLGNALKFTSEGGFSLHVFTRDTEAGAELCFEVFDTGIGISPEDQARLFTRFTQVDASSRRRHSGTGLGLAISRQLSQLMGGDVTLVSRAGHGSTFTVRIPLQLAAAPRAETAAALQVVKTDARVLLVEDNEVNQLVAQRMLAKLGYTNVTPALTGREAVDACSRAPFDLVLMDCQMPVMDGWEATEQLRAMGVKAPILAFTASATSGDRDRCIAAGMNDYLTKPVELAILADKMQRWLEGVPEHAKEAATAAAPSQPVFDRETLTTRFLGDTSLFSEAREMFVRHTRQLLDELPRAQLDLPALRKAMHRIRGSAAMLGAAWLADVTLQVELDEEATEAEILPRLDEARRAFEAFEAESAQALALPGS